MKTATLPPLRVRPELRQAAEDLLAEGESLSAFVEDAVRRNIEMRRRQRDFLARGLAGREAARQSGDYVSAEAVLDKLDQRLQAARKRQA